MRCKRSKPRSWMGEANRQDFLWRHTTCQVCRGTTLSSEAHHILGRGWHGADDDRNLLGVCRPCHEPLHTVAGKVQALHAKFKSDELDLDWFEGRVGYSVRGKLEGVWYDAVDEAHQSLIREMLA